MGETAYEVPPSRVSIAAATRASGNPGSGAPRRNLCGLPERAARTREVSSMLRRSHAPALRFTLPVLLLFVFVALFAAGCGGNY